MAAMRHIRSSSSVATAHTSTINHQNFTIVEDSLSAMHDGLNSFVQTTAMVAALLSTWGLAIYVDQPEESKCESVNLDHIVFAEWMALGWFFLCVSSSIILILDLGGVPRALLAAHLRRVWLLYLIPPVSLFGGIVFLAAGFALDIGARIGCWAFIFGAVVAPSFVICCLLILAVLGYARRTLPGKTSKAYSEHNAATLSVATFLVRAHAVLQTESLVADPTGNMASLVEFQLGDVECQPWKEPLGTSQAISL